MATVSAHIRNVDYEHVEIVIKDDFTGAILGNKIFFEKPSALSLQTARSWLQDKYSTQNLNITTEGFEAPLSSKTVNEEGVVVLKPAPSGMESQTFEDYLNENSVPTNNEQQLQNAVSLYMSSVQERNMSVPPLTSTEASYISLEPQQAGSISDEDKIITPESDDETVLLQSTTFHEVYNTYTPDAGHSDTELDGEVSYA